MQLRCSRLGKTNTWLIPIGELNAGSFKSALNHVERCTSRLAYPRLQLMDGHDPQASAFGKLLLAPSEQSPCCPALSRRKHFIRLPEASDSHNSIKFPLTLYDPPELDDEIAR